MQNTLRKHAYKFDPLPLLLYSKTGVYRGMN